MRTPLPKNRPTSTSYAPKWASASPVIKREAGPRRRSNPQHWALEAERHGRNSQDPHLNWSGRPDHAPVTSFRCMAGLNRRPLPPQVVEEEVPGVQTFWPVRIDRIFGDVQCLTLPAHTALRAVMESGVPPVSHRCPTRIARIRLAVRSHRTSSLMGRTYPCGLALPQSALGVCEHRASVTTTSGWCGRNTAALEGISSARQKLGPEKGQNSADRQRARLNHSGASAFMLQQIAVSP